MWIHTFGVPHPQHTPVPSPPILHLSLQVIVALLLSHSNFPDTVKGPARIFMFKWLRDWLRGEKTERGHGRQVAGDKIILTLIALTAESAGSTATLMAVPVSTVSVTTFYRSPEVEGELICGVMYPLSVVGWWCGDGACLCIPITLYW